MAIRPRGICSEEGCKLKQMYNGKSVRKDGTVSRTWKKLCPKHHNIKYQMGDWQYKQHREEFCENQDGRLGYKCTGKIVWEGQLDVDHIDGNHENNDIENLQTLCKSCHAFKTWLYKDWENRTNKEVIT